MRPGASRRRASWRAARTEATASYAVEIMQRLGLPDGVVRAGVVHYNTADEVDRLMHELARLA